MADLIENESRVKETFKTLYNSNPFYNITEIEFNILINELSNNVILENCLSDKYDKFTILLVAQLEKIITDILKPMLYIENINYLTFAFGIILLSLANPNEKSLDLLRYKHISNLVNSCVETTEKVNCLVLIRNLSCLSNLLLFTCLYFVLSKFYLDSNQIESLISKGNITIENEQYALIEEVFDDFFTSKVNSEYNINEVEEQLFKYWEGSINNIFPLSNYMYEVMDYNETAEFSKELTEASIDISAHLDKFIVRLSNTLDLNNLFIFFLN